MNEDKLNLWNRVKLIYEIITIRSGHRHPTQLKKLSTFLKGYEAGMKDEKYNTKDLERQLAEAREVAKDAIIQLGYYSACGGTQATEFLVRNKDFIKQLKEKGDEQKASKKEKL